MAIMLRLLLFGWLGRLLAELGFVKCRKLLFTGRIADKALRFGAVVFLAPVAFGLELVGRLGAAHAAFFFRHTVFDAPPARVGRIFFVFVRRVGGRLRTAVIGRLPAAIAKHG